MTATAGTAGKFISTTSIMSEERRRDVVAIARRHDLILIEDDVYGFLLEDQPTRLAMLAEDRVIYVSSASKCLIPGLRVGWEICRNETIVERLKTLAFSLHIASPALIPTAGIIDLCEPTLSIRWT